MANETKRTEVAIVLVENLVKTFVEIFPKSRGVPVVASHHNASLSARPFLAADEVVLNNETRQDFLHLILIEVPVINL